MMPGWLLMIAYITMAVLLVGFIGFALILFVAVVRAMIKDLKEEGKDGRHKPRTDNAGKM